MKENVQVDLSNTYFQYDDLEVAKRACKKDSQCIGVFLAICNMNGPYMLLKRGFVISVSGVNCLYKKKRDGRYIFLVMLFPIIEIHMLVIEF